jgi:protein-S-isoprenylcysteine O-methyltransferase Ste14
VVTPDGDSHADAVARLKTELFMAHYHVRTIGYVCFAALVVLIALGFSTRRTGLGALGAVGLMLPVFAQFAGVMFFLAGLGVLNVVWLPVLDLSYGIQHWGSIIDAPNDLLRWLLGLVGVHSPWPTTVFFIAVGILLFLLGVYGWLSARMRGNGVANSWVYRISRHPQYLGWILWTYGTYLLVQQVRYPKRSWGIDASLPWLISTAVIVGVAMMEELSMRTRHGKAYDAYRKHAPFLFPLPRFLDRIFTMPQRLLFGREQPTRKREVVTVVTLYTALLVGISALFYAGGAQRISLHFASADTRLTSAEERQAVGTNSEHQTDGPDADAIIAQSPTLLASPEFWKRRGAVSALGALDSPAAVALLAGMLHDESAEVRREVAIALLRTGRPEARPVLERMLSDEDLVVRIYATEALRRVPLE